MDSDFNVHKPGLALVVLWSSVNGGPVEVDVNLARISRRRSVVASTLVMRMMIANVKLGDAPPTLIALAHEVA